VASGGTLERPALSHLLADIEQGRTDMITAYKIDRLSRSLTDLARLVDAPSFNSSLDPSLRRGAQASAGHPIRPSGCEPVPTPFSGHRVGVDSKYL
jgi:hypothetical protein